MNQMMEGQEPTMEAANAEPTVKLGRYACTVVRQMEKLQRVRWVCDHWYLRGSQLRFGMLPLKSPLSSWVTMPALW